MQEEQRNDLASITADIVAAYVANNSVRATYLPALIKTVHAAMSAAAGGVIV